MKKTHCNKKRFKLIIALIILLGIHAKANPFNHSKPYKEYVGIDCQKKNFVYTKNTILERIEDTEIHSQANEKQPKNIQIIGTWYDRITSDFSYSYKLYKSNGKVYLNFADKDIQCTPYKIKGKEFTFRDEINGIYTLASGTLVYIGKNFLEAVDRNIQPYKSNMVLLIQDEFLFVYANNLDKNIYDIYCAATL